MANLQKMIIFFILCLTDFAYLFKFFVFVGSFAQTLQITNITTTPFLSNNEIATGYNGLKLMIRIEAADLYQVCRWLKKGISIGTIFNRNFNDITCNTNNVRTENHHFSCVEENQVVTATVAFVSPVDINDNGNYQVECSDASLAEFIIAQINIMVMGKTSCNELR